MQDEDPSDDLIRDVVAGDEQAWARLVGLVMPRIRRIAATHPVMRRSGLALQPDEVAEVATASVERLARSNKRNLAMFLERARPEDRAPQSFDSWIYGAVDYTIRDHVRARSRKGEELLGRVAVASPEHDDHLDDDQRLIAKVERALGVTTQLTVVQILQFIQATFEPEEVRALRLHYGADASLSELATALGLPDDAAADRMLRKLKARLRARFDSE